MTFLGTLDELKVLVDSLDGQGHWEHKGQFEMFIFGGPDTNLRLNWWPKSGELTLVGDPAERVGVSASLQRLLAAR
ncbi:hypothetical protein KQ302_00900 [Synechococcus sp. CS-602]|uniref:hypothetical protein n=1 Tax=Synechococcaceae TaxID=1890426 RepID=UPI0008FF1215|nr:MULTISPECIES: hypothetical protein [Synechococcaceae]MCT4363672.1 hypothetical protein [Candidatus Regnicoccus frigidus MAG-AL1]APD47335.1 hypothetical protein BM449_02220 [Synechococcus sp. SynAce01]MCT0202766.1 hypothetical protein [Synechococcus sp. CS-603]MCT0203679.1 hypothetical protein [Synechococcus sp. CS-602]MCT0245324.1 hypothetical protein [Synechococcus sp. CS-601]